MEEYTTLKQYLLAIQTLPANRPLNKQDLLTEQFLMEKEAGLELYYAPHNEYINRNAQLLIVGITPGWKQMKTAYEQLIHSLAAGEGLDASLKKTKIAAGFAGSMRTNLIHMLDQLHIPEALGVPQASDLFGNSRNLLHTTSVIKYPVFLKGKNYSGHQPAIDRSSLLSDYAYREFPNELVQIKSQSLVIPLGKGVEDVFKRLNAEQKLPEHIYLYGFPHSSGANGHRIKQFEERKTELRDMVRKWGQKRG